jgi:hypothetical protein
MYPAAATSHYNPLDKKKYWSREREEKSAGGPDTIAADVYRLAAAGELDR